MHDESVEKKLDILRKLHAGAKVAFINSGDDKVSEYAIQTMLAARQLKKYGACEVTLVAPFLPFARQDKVSDDRMEFVAADDYPFLLKASGVDRVVTIESHSEASLGHLCNHFGAQALHLSTDGLFAQTLQTEADRLSLDLVIGAPDGADKPHDAGQRRAGEI
jgi:phosphoribosylpyrophosphate synthetase